jgi:hypothetical protein
MPVPGRKLPPPFMLRVPAVGREEPITCLCEMAAKGTLLPLLKGFPASAFCINSSQCGDELPPVRYWVRRDKQSSARLHWDLTWPCSPSIAAEGAKRLCSDMVLAVVKVIVIHNFSGLFAAALVQALLRPDRE